METTETHIADANRYQFDGNLIGQGYAQIDSEQDAWYFGTWLHPKKLHMITYAEGDVIAHQFESAEEFIGFIVSRKEMIGYEQIDDFAAEKAIPIEREALEGYLGSFATQVE